ncbi:dynein light chain Tctex-type 5-like [Mercenaria mercenaria]|uniref:dynein light chain Tctex-type 5-like n=1 Tax=Mercenaria mercenaria TaxID=6596 RepID=UPI00234F714B|nr:dynein light chain Tctex-type 5-like [Mercenaria mercenaria]
MTTPTDATNKIPAKTTPDVQKDDVFTEWRSRKASINAFSGLKPPGDISSRRKSNLRDLTTHLAGARGAGLRRLTMSIRAKSDISADMVKPTVKKENTYRMRPDDDKGFSVAKVEKAVKELFEDELEGVEYSHDTSSKLACEISEKVKERVKDFNFARFKISVNVIVGQVDDQGMEVVSRCVWDDKLDRSVCVTFKNKSLYVIALIFGVYFE